MSDNKPAFIKISPGAKVSGLTATDNTMRGHGDFINNEGTLEDAKLKNNRHIIPNQIPASPNKRWFEKPLGILSLGVIASLLAWAVLHYYGLA